MNFLLLQKKETDELTNDLEDFSLTKKKKKKPVNIEELDNVSYLANKTFVIT